MIQRAALLLCTFIIHLRLSQIIPTENYTLFFGERREMGLGTDGDNSLMVPESLFAGNSYFTSGTIVNVQAVDSAIRGCQVMVSRAVSTASDAYRLVCLYEPSTSALSTYQIRIFDLTYQLINGQNKSPKLSSISDVDSDLSSIFGLLFIHPGTEGYFPGSRLQNHHFDRLSTDGFRLRKVRLERK
jgi:hypothetical protein